MMQYHIPEDCNMQPHCCENLKSSSSQVLYSVQFWWIFCYDAIEICVEGNFVMVLYPFKYCGLYLLGMSDAMKWQNLRKTL